MKDLLRVVLFIFICFVMLGIGVAYSSTTNHQKVIKICNHYNKKEEINIDCNLISALAKSESHYQIESYHPEKTGSYGLLQIQCGTAKARGLKFGCEQLFGLMTNIRFGMFYLDWIYNKLGYMKNKGLHIETQNVISAWNAGMEKVGMNYFPLRCKNYNKFKWQDFPPVECYPGEYINEEYVWKVYRRYKYLKDKERI